MVHVLIFLILLTGGISGILDKKAVETSSPGRTFLAFHLFGIPVSAMALVVLILCYPDWHLSAGLVLWQGVSAFAAMLAVLAYFGAMRQAEATYVLGMTATYPMVTQILAVLFLKEEFCLGGLLSALLVACGACIVGATKTSTSHTSSKWQTMATTLLVATVAIFWGVDGVTQKLALAHGRPLEAFLAKSVWEVALTLPALVLFSRRGVTVSSISSSTWKLVILVAISTVVHNLALVSALNLASASYVIVFSACFPLVTYALALGLREEKLNWMRLGGMLLIIGGGALAELSFA